MKYYHATDFKNLVSILDEGLNTGCDGVIYLTKDPKEAIRFVVLRGVKKALVCEVEVDENNVIETFDHSELFYKCRAYGHKGKITVDQITDYIEYLIYNQEELNENIIL